jgi:hypothetical protein
MPAHEAKQKEQQQSQQRQLDVSSCNVLNASY